MEEVPRIINSGRIPQINISLRSLRSPLRSLREIKEEIPRKDRREKIKISILLAKISSY